MSTFLTQQPPNTNGEVYKYLCSHLPTIIELFEQHPSIGIRNIRFNLGLVEVAILKMSTGENNPWRAVISDDLSETACYGPEIRDAVLAVAGLYLTEQHSI